MQLNVYDIINRVKSMRMVMDSIDDDKSIDEFKGFIYQICDEYSEILQSAKVKF